jgi:hypothetical protein
MKPFGLKVQVWISVVAVLLLLAACGTARNGANVNKVRKLGGEDLREDFTLLRNILEKEHPSLYWYTPKDSMDMVFNREFSNIKDSMNELQFKNLLLRTVSPIKCGHTSLRNSKQLDKFMSKARFPFFPIGMRLWNDTMVSSYNLYRKDTLLKRGSIIKSINGLSARQITDSLFQVVTTDGNANNFKNLRISNNFPYNYLLVFDSSKQYDIVYADSSGTEKSLRVGAYRPPPPDTSRRNRPPVPTITLTPAQRKQLRLESIRRLRIDTFTSTAFVDLTSFTGGRQKKFFRKTFKRLRKEGIQNLVLDLRNNGGGLMGNAVALSRYVSSQPFKVADTVAAVTRFSSYNRYIKNRFWYGLSMVPFCHKKRDGRYHFGWWERHFYKPRKKNHFGGQVYAISGGYSFSATTLFLNAVKGQANVTVVGEETGGGSYGNSAVYIPEITLPNSRLRVRLPVFRLVMNKDYPKNGRGIVPDIYAGPSIEAVKKGGDPKMETVKELIKAKRKKEK